MSALPCCPPAFASSEEKREAPLLERGWKMVDAARGLFRGALPPEALEKTWRDRRRGFTAVDYLSLLLIGLYNPAVRTLRGLCGATVLPRLQRQWGCGPMPLASVSDAQHLIDPALLLPVIGELSARVQAQAAAAGGGASRSARAGFALKVVDSSVFPALSRMVWAAYGAGRPRKDGRAHQAVRFHVSFDVSSGSPERVTVTPGRICERRVWRDTLKSAPVPPVPRPDGKIPLAIQTGDRNYGSDFALLEKLAAEGIDFLVRLRIHEHPEVVEELPLSAEDRAEGMVRQAWVLLGKSWRRPSALRRTGGARQKGGGQPQAGQAVRVMWIQRGDQMVVLATTLPPEVLSAALAGQMYRERWQVEFFFRWIKCLLGCDHWLAQSEKGATVQLYLVMVAALLLQLQCGRRPNRRMLELVHFYFTGLASVEDLERGLARAAAAAEKTARSKRLYAQKKAAGRQ
jgi:hypothetical protein